MRNAQPLRVGALLAALVGVSSCTASPQACSERAVVSFPQIDISAIDLESPLLAEVCVEDECRQSATGGQLVEEEQLIAPSSPTVRVSLALSLQDGQVQWYASGDIGMTAAEPNGPGCGVSYVLPPLTAYPDGTLVAG